MDPFHERLARVALDVAASYGSRWLAGLPFRLTGSLTAHQPTWTFSPEADAQFDFSQAVDAVVAAYRRNQPRLTSEGSYRSQPLLV
jgi:hypothetical protein